MEPHIHFTHEELQEYVHKVYGTGYLVAGIARIHGGAQKVVYKIDCKMVFLVYCMFGILPKTISRKRS